VTIARGSDGVFSEYNLTKTQADAVFLQTSGPGIHVEFKNTKVGQLQGKYYTYDKNWAKMNQHSEEIYQMDDNKVLNHELQFQTDKLKTVRDQWNTALTQAQENKKLLLQQHKNKEFISYAVYRVGLKKLFWKTI